jgi:hypothetical protein
MKSCIFTFHLLQESHSHYDMRFLMRSVKVLSHIINQNEFANIIVNAKHGGKKKFRYNTAFKWSLLQI